MLLIQFWRSAFQHYVTSFGGTLVVFDNLQHVLCVACRHDYLLSLHYDGLLTGLQAAELEVWTQLRLPFPHLLGWAQELVVGHL